MPQGCDETALSPGQHLDREWRLFQSIESGASAAFFRIWETDRPTVVIGRSQAIPDHVFQESCQRDSVAVIRRFSGGGAVVLGPGCLNYALGFSLVSRPDLADVPESFRTILGTLADALAVRGLTVDGTADLVLDGRKVSGNAQRRGRHAVLHHGTLLYDFDAALAARYLKELLRQPSHRAFRTHAHFMGNLPLSGELLRSRLMEWGRRWDEEVAHR
jgi:lipoate-protein ligase A